MRLAPLSRAAEKGSHVWAPSRAAARRARRSIDVCDENDEGFWEEYTCCAAGCGLTYTASIFGFIAAIVACAIAPCSACCQKCAGDAAPAAAPATAQPVTELTDVAVVQK